MLYSIFIVMVMGLNWRMYGINGPLTLLDSISFNGHRMSYLARTRTYYSSMLMKVEGNSNNFRSHPQSRLDHSSLVKENGPTYSLLLTYCKFSILNQNGANTMILFLSWINIYISQFDLFPFTAQNEEKCLLANIRKK